MNKDPQRSIVSLSSETVKGLACSSCSLSGGDTQAQRATVQRRVGTRIQVRLPILLALRSKDLNSLIRKIEKKISALSH